MDVSDQFDEWRGEREQERLEQARSEIEDLKQQLAASEAERERLKTEVDNLNAQIAQAVSILQSGIKLPPGQGSPANYSSDDYTQPSRLRFKSNLSMGKVVAFLYLVGIAIAIVILVLNR